MIRVWQTLGTKWQQKNSEQQVRMYCALSHLIKEVSVTSLPLSFPISWPLPERDTLWVWFVQQCCPTKKSSNNNKAFKGFWREPSARLSKERRAGVIDVASWTASTKLDNVWAFDACRLYAGRGTYGSKQVCFGLLGWCERNLSPSQAVMDLQLSFKSNTIIPSTFPEQKRMCQRSVGWGMAGQVISNTLGMIVAVELQIGTLLWTLRRCSQRWKMSVLLEDPPNLHICK